ncbi:DNA/RNA polymerase [Ascobolus immersus RN42]|uniref:DNA polymerase eta n=1 Tax=Ascobolus immersus RN42 TaxID=1160509 RepID=A0A3N4ICP8_ASCIM|nr:DNA/RNA polymerase [Ascobolus immersus RN42]
MESADFMVPSCQQATPQTYSQVNTEPVSKFNWRHLSRLGNNACDSPLRVIAHIDLDAFYAQCEMVRTKSPEDVPLAVSQWGSLLAINYPARARGLKSRMVSAAEAKKICPELRVVHIATWKPGERYWAYRPDHENNIATCKSCLDPYRNESKKIFAIFRKHCGAVEKGGTDEAFMDLGKNVYDTLLERYPQLKAGPKNGDLNERLPMFEGEIQWVHGILVEEEMFSQAEAEPPDWDDVVLNIGAEIVANIRKDVRETLGYTTSGGIAQNKMLAKLGSAVNKPNKQTIVRPRAVKTFLEGIKLTKIRNLGGKLGDKIAQLYETTSIPEMLKIPLQQFCLNMPQDEAQWLWNTIRGIDYSPVRTKQVSRSMLSSKQFRPAITNITELENWMDIFCAEIGTRLEEEGCATGSNRPKTVNVHWFRRGIGSKSRQAPITTGLPLDRDVLFKMAKTILRQLEQEKQLFPCSGCSFSVTGFSGGGGPQKGGNERAIDTFFTKQAKKTEPEEDREGLEEVEQELELDRMEDMEEDNGIPRGQSPSPQKSKQPVYPRGSIEERMEEARRRYFARPDSTALPTPTASTTSQPIGQSPERKRFFTGSSTPVTTLVPPPKLGLPDLPSPKRPRFFGNFTPISNPNSSAASKVEAPPNSHVCKGSVDLAPFTELPLSKIRP